MPTAESFNALGVGNGFPSCITKVDVSGYDYWTTLSDVNKDSPATSDQLISDSRRAGMKLFWNLNAVNCDAIYETFDGDILSVSSATIGIFDEVGSAIEPKNRVCQTSGFQTSTTDPNGSLFNHAQIGSNRLNICRMYDGPTSNEANFVGYGATKAQPFSPRFSFIGCSGGAAGKVCFTTLGGYLNEEDLSFTIEDYQYVNIGDVASPIWVVCSAVAENTGTASGTVNASLLISEVTFTSGATVRNGKAEITSLDFYTYA